MLDTCSDPTTNDWPVVSDGILSEAPMDIELVMLGMSVSTITLLDVEIADGESPLMEVDCTPPSVDAKGFGDDTVAEDGGCSTVVGFMTKVESACGRF